jgi:esterase/lipase superfamily enzyme/GNAT superfamily N-acetyltransferase
MSSNDGVAHVSKFPYLKTLQFENDGTRPNEGVWPLNFWRCCRRHGDPGDVLFPYGRTLIDADDLMMLEAAKRATFCYFRVRTSSDAIQLLQHHPEVRYSCELTSEWYDPPFGQIKGIDDEIQGYHAVPIVAFDSKTDSFVFANSWGSTWGRNGWGTLKRDAFDHRMMEAWCPYFASLDTPPASGNIVCQEWKLMLDGTVEHYGREIRDAKSNQRLAWAFCKKCDDFLDVEEFFVWPAERGKGYGRALAKMVLELAKGTRLPLRVLVSFTDTEQSNETNLNSVSQLLGVTFVEAKERWLHLYGFKHANSVQPYRIRPTRPTSVLEKLRPVAEKSLKLDTSYQVFFATDRQLQPGKDGINDFGGTRGHHLTYGVATVEIPETYQFGSIGRTWYQYLRELFRILPRLKELTLFEDQADFVRLAAEVISGFAIHQKPFNLLYVHGFNVQFAEAVNQAARFGVDLKVPGATFLYSWPSKGNSQPFSYTTDEATIDLAHTHLQSYICLLLRSFPEMPLNIVVHSMGNRAVCKTLAQIASVANQTGGGRIENVIFAAPDVDADTFKSDTKQFANSIRRATLYGTDKDRALSLSAILHGYPRAGLFPPIHVIDGVDTIHVHGFNLLDLGHSYYANAAQILHDMFTLLHVGSRPESRGGLRSKQTSTGEQYWEIKIG